MELSPIETIFLRKQTHVENRIIFHTKKKNKFSMFQSMQVKRVFVVHKHNSTKNWGAGGVAQQ
jgi:adenine deaminase